MPKASINADAVRDLAALLDETGLTEIEYESGTLRLRVSRQATAAVSSAGPPMSASAPAASNAGPDVGGDEAPVGSSAPATDHPGAINSPMVGTVYTAPEPGSDDFVAIGDTVSAGQTLLLIEAMKTFNEIRAPKSGAVKSIHVQNEQPVEFGDILMIIE